jgi:dolichol-phosphate mannosyltransferase
MKLSIVVPLYNEDENVAKLHAELLPVARKLLGSMPAHLATIDGVELIFVDDGSVDRTVAEIQEKFHSFHEDDFTIQLIRHEMNRGLGAALRTGLAAANGDIIVTTDCDGTYSFGEIPSLLNYFTPAISIVTASPYHPEGRVAGVPVYRLLLSRGSSLLYRLLVDWHIHTYTALFRAYRRAVIERVNFHSNGFLGGTELLVKARLDDFAVAEYPAVLHARQYGVSKAKLVRTIRAHLQFQAELLWWRLGLMQREQLYTQNAK